MSRTNRALVTGGAGFIGSNLVGELLRLGWSVRVLDNYSTGKRKHLSSFSGSSLEVQEGDIRNPEDCDRACQGVDYVFHQAALRSVPRSIDDPAATNEANVRGTLNMLQAAVKAGVQRFIYASSSSVYGDSSQMPQDETQLPQPVSPYAVSKLAGEHYCQSFAKTFSLETVSLRYFNVFGPHQDPESKYSAVIPAFIFQLGRGEPFEIHWDGKQSRDFTFVDDVVQANLLAAQALSVSGMVFNIANSKSRSVLEVAETIGAILGRDPGRRFTARRQGDVRKTWASIEQARRLLTYEPRVSFEEGLRRTVDYFHTIGLIG